MEKDQEMLEHIVKSIVENPEDVEISRQKDDMGILLTLRVAKEDMGTIIGSQGSMASSLRTILRAIGRRNDARVSMHIEEPEV